MADVLGSAVLSEIYEEQKCATYHQSSFQGGVVQHCSFLTLLEDKYIRALANILVIIKKASRPEFLGKPQNFGVPRSQSLGNIAG